MNIYRREMQLNIKGMLIWCIILAGLGILVMAFFPTIADQAQVIQQLMAGMPAGLLEAFGLQRISLTDILGFYASKQYPTITLFGSIYAIMLAAGILSKEDNDRTIEFLLSKPVTRSAVVTYKMLSVVTLIIVFNTIISIVMFIALQIVKVKDFSIPVFLLLCLGPLFMHLTFAAIGLLLSVLIRKTRTILPLALGILLVTYFLSIAAVLSEKLDFLKYLSPFKYVDAIDIITRQSIEPLYLVLMLAITTISVLLTYVVYNRRDILI